MNKPLTLMIGERTFAARLEPGAPQTIAWLRNGLPIHGKALHARWSGEAAWVRLSNPISVPSENATAHPAPGDLLLYLGGVSEPELLIPYVACAFASRAGTLAGNHVATIIGCAEELPFACEATLIQGAQAFQIDWETMA